MRAGVIEAGGSLGPKVAVVGCGRWGRNHVRNYAELGALAAVVDRTPSVAAEQARTHRADAISFEEALGRADIEALVFALPPSLNLPLGKRALEAGKHLFVEKPLALSVEDAESLVRLAETHDRRLMVGHILQYHPAFAELARIVASGRLGRLMSLTSTRLDLGRIRREEDALWALAPHDVSMVLRLVGRQPSAVSAEAGYHTHARIADAASMGLGFADGVRAEIRVSWLHPVKEQRLTAVGTDAMAVFDDRESWDRKLVLHPYRLVETGDAPALDRGDPVPVAVEPGEPLRLECMHFLRCVRSGETPVTDGQEGLRVLRVLERAERAMAVGHQASP